MATMVTAMVFVKVEQAQLEETATTLAEIGGVAELYSVTGKIDLVGLIRVADNDAVAAVVAKINKVAGVRSTETHLAFRTWSKVDSAFDIGV